MNPSRLAKFTLTAIVMLSVSVGCASTNETPSGKQREKPVTTVNVATAQLGTLGRDLDYTGITRPFQVVSLRSRVEGQLLNLAVDVGDRVKTGQILGRIDDRLLATIVREQQAQLASLEAELGRAKIQVNNARIEVERLRLQYQQARNDAARFTQLAAEGAIPLQQAETARTTAAVAQKAVNSARSGIQAEEQVVAGILGRIAAQKSVIAQERQRQDYTVLTSPLNGIVLERVSEPGNLVSVGGEVVKIGDFQQVKVIVLVSELDLKEIQEGKTVQVKLDAFGKRIFPGRISRISPLTQGTARQIPVEITVANDDGLIKGGLLARVTFTVDRASRLLVPESAIIDDGENSAIFVLPPSSNQVEKRRIRVGQRIDGQVEILGGIEARDRFVVNSSQPLQGGETVRVSILSREKNSDSR